ncbi:MAG: hypothetical protein M0R46_06655 [Candidatus Muirbacterium halophilum]|nr:hypothetical protein [Candidatus Muirbacterium halophilum]
MSIVGTFSGPPAPLGGSASANEYSLIEELLHKLPDNDANLIQAKDIRDSVYTLWERIEDLSISISQSSIPTYSSDIPSSATNLEGFPVGTTFSNVPLTEMWDTLLHPYIPPMLSLTSGVGYREYGASNIVQLNWSVKASILPTQITVTGVNIPPTGLYMNGSLTASATQNVPTTFTMSVVDEKGTYNTSVNFTWRFAIYWGRTSTFALPSMVISGSQPSWADGASYSSGKMLSTTFRGKFDGVNGAGQYLVFAWPTSFGEPTFVVNGLINTAFTKLGESVPHTNQYGYNTTYDVWLTDTVQNSPISSFEIK